MKKIFLFLLLISNLGIVVYGQTPTPSNYIIFFDFSSRIENSNQPQKDKELMKYIITNFRQKVESMYRSGYIYSEDKLNILFYPDLEDENILSLTSSMNIDFGGRDFKTRLKYFINQFPKEGNPKILTTFDKVYEIALKQNPNYFGSNIYDFFSYSVDNYLKDGYKNHIIIFTDGYMYMAGENPERVGNSVGHLEGSILDPLRSSSNWQKDFKMGDWKIISSGNKLKSNTTITLLEITPDCIQNSLTPRTKIKPLKQCPDEYKILERLWTNWFLDMGAEDNKIKVVRTSNDLNGIKSVLRQLF
ncbi:hypothetical protein ATE92_0576 [Ulvibacter sp. MAR_2010_11]|uniref:hypothetical protein n=1 Tax=Ulvibacter sp. MAR_2010_11 TaxID=1250229 RepID=UPI000C2B5972|nr:hypothetical protein [Ulvibacter sp. MAR_2010_11]PKA82447.1 hypothetical protein ATE92_0576 [Ulvibacter sp. MAR_2010_11]